MTKISSRGAAAPRASRPNTLGPQHTSVWQTSLLFQNVTSSSLPCPVTCDTPLRATRQATPRSAPQKWHNLQEQVILRRLRHRMPTWTSLLHTPKPRTLLMNRRMLRERAAPIQVLVLRLEPIRHGQRPGSPATWPGSSRVDADIVCILIQAHEPTCHSIRGGNHGHRRTVGTAEPPPLG